MASPSFFHFFFLITILLMITNPSHSLKLETEDPKVNVSLYYETLCPGCQRYIVEELGDLYKDSELMSIVNLRLVPYGNAQILENGTVEFQHGPDECYLNTIEACALDMWPSLETSFPFIQCVEGALQQESDNLTITWTSCCEQLGIDSDRIKHCYETGHGDELIFSYGKETDALTPPRTFVPWVTVNGDPLGFDLYNLKNHICDAYKGPRKLKACNNVHVATSSAEKMKSTQAVCHAIVEGVSP